MPHFKNVHIYITQWHNKLVWKLNTKINKYYFGSVLKNTVLEIEGEKVNVVDGEGVNMVYNRLRKRIQDVW